MNKLFCFIGSTLGSWLGWSIGDYLFMDNLFASFFLSTVFAIIGVYYGWKLAQAID
jgi:hypothetical protein